MALPKHCPISLSCFVTCAILSVPTESDQCAPVKARFLPAFSLLGGEDPGRAEPSDAEHGAGAPVSATMLQKEQAQESSRTSCHSPCHHED